jgi:hypothetical protein
MYTVQHSVPRRSIREAAPPSDPPLLRLTLATWSTASSNTPSPSSMSTPSATTRPPASADDPASSHASCTGLAKQREVDRPMATVEATTAPDGTAAAGPKSKTAARPARRPVWARSTSEGRKVAATPPTTPPRPSTTRARPWKKGASGPASAGDTTSVNHPPHTTSPDQKGARLASGTRRLPPSAIGENLHTPRRQGHTCENVLAFKR